MALAMIYGRSGSGKTTELFRRLKAGLKDADITRKRYVIVPDQFSYMMEKKILEQFGEENGFKIQVVGFRTLSQRILEQTGGIKKPLLSPVGQSMLISSLALKKKPELKLYRKSAAYAGFADLLAQTIKEMKNYAITPLQLAETAAALHDSELKFKLQDVALLYGAYEEELHRGFIDAEDQLDTAIRQLKESDYLRGSAFYIDEFSDFTPKQLEMLEVLLGKGDVTITLTYDEGLGLNHKGVFALPVDTDRALMDLAAKRGVSLTKPVFLKGAGRFEANPELAHVEREFYSYPNAEYPERVSTVRLYRAQNPYEEMEYVARDIIRQVRDNGLRFQDMAILLRDLDTYGAILQSVMDQFEIPVFIDARKEIDTNPLASFIAGFFEIRRRNFQGEAVFRYLKTMLLPIPREVIDALENYCIANGVSGWKWQEEIWTWPVPDVKNELSAQRLLNELNEVRDLITEPLNETYQAMEAAGTVREMAGLFYEFLVHSHALLTFSDWIEALAETEPEAHREYSQIMDSLMQILDQMVEAMGDESMTLDDFGNTLLVGLSSIKISLIPATLDQVIVGDIARVRSGGVKGIYIVGTNDGILPRTPGAAGIFTDSDREMLSQKMLHLSKDARTRAFYEQFYVYNALTIGTNFLTVTYPTSDAEGKALRPSMIIGRLKKLFPRLEEEISQSYLEKGSPGRESISSEREAFRELIGQMRRHHDGIPVDPVWRAIYDRFRRDPDYQARLDTVADGLRYTNYPAELKAEHMDQLYGKKLHLTVSRLEHFSRCPFAYFVKYGLRAKERKEFVLSTPDVGSLMHDVLDRFTKKIKEDGLDWKKITPDYTRTAVDQLMEQALEAQKNPILASSRRYQHMTGKIKRIIASSVDVIQNQIVRGEFEPLYTEVAFGPHEDIPAIVLDLDNGREVNINGRIDRIDVLRRPDRNYIRIIDYKSGMKELDLSDIIHGLQLQLLVYLDVILRNSQRFLQGETLPGAVLYYRIHRPTVENGAEMTDEELELRILKDLRLKGLILDDASVVRSMDKDMMDVSLVIHAKLKNEEVRSDSQKQEALIISRQQFDQLRDYVAQTIKRISLALINGDISIRPYRTDTVTACQYCEYRSICQFDPSQKGNEYNRIRKMKPEEAWLYIDGSDHNGPGGGKTSGGGDGEAMKETRKSEENREPHRINVIEGGADHAELDQ